MKKILLTVLAFAFCFSAMATSRQDIIAILKSTAVIHVLKNQEIQSIMSAGNRNYSITTKRCTMNVSAFNLCSGSSCVVEVSFDLSRTTCI